MEATGLQTTLDRVIERGAAKDWIGVLGLVPGSTYEDMTRSYRRIAAQIHPDKCRDPRATDAFKFVTAAHMELDDRTTFARRIVAYAAESVGRAPVPQESGPPRCSAADVFAGIATFARRWDSGPRNRADDVRPPSGVSVQRPDAQPRPRSATAFFGIFESDVATRERWMKEARRNRPVGRDAGQHGNSARSVPHQPPPAAAAAASAAAAARRPQPSRYRPQSQAQPQSRAAQRTKYCIPPKTPVWMPEPSPQVAPAVGRGEPVEFDDAKKRKTVHEFFSASKRRKS